MSPIIIRDCEERDLEAVAGLMKELEEVATATSDFAVDNLKSLVKEMGKLPEIYRNIVAEYNGRVVGFISLIFYKTLFHKGGTALINELIVNRECRGRGIGTALVQTARDEALKRGMDELEVGTECDNKAARSFYKKCSFNEEYVLLGMEFEEKK